MTDDKQHEYVPQIAPGVLDARLQVKDLELRELKADLRQAQHDHTELLIERNNMAEALRVVNARLVEVTADLAAAKDSHLMELATLESHRLGEELRADQAEAERDGWRARAEKCEGERNAALLKRLGDDRQSAREMEDDEQ